MESLLENILHLGIDVFDIYIIYRYMTIFFDGRCNDKHLTFCAYLLKFGIGVESRYVNFIMPVNMLIYLVSNFLITLGYVSKISKKILVISIIYLSSFISEIMVAMVIGVGHLEFTDKTIHINEFYEIIIEILFWMITLIIRRYKNIKNDVPVNKVFVTAIAVIPVSLVCLEIIIFQQNHLSEKVSVISVLCMVVCDFAVIYLYDSLSEMFMEHSRAVLLAKERDYYHEQSELIQRHYKELRKFRHDMKNRMIVIQEMSDNGGNKAVSEYTRKLADRLEQIKTYSMTGNIAIDSVINYKMTQAYENNISVETDIAIPEKLEADEDDMAVVLGNALDNAIEAVLKVRNENERYIKIKMEYDQEVLFIYIKNSFDSVVKDNGTKLLTRKKDKKMHGIGLQSINDIVGKYRGEVELRYSGNEFLIQIVLYLDKH